MNNKRVIHFSAAPDCSLPLTARCRELLYSGGVGACVDVGGGVDIGYDAKNLYPAFKWPEFAEGFVLKVLSHLEL